MKKHYKFSVNETHSFELTGEEQLDAVQSTDGKIHVLDGQKSYQAEVIDTDFHKRSYKVKVNGKEYEVKIASPLDQLVDEMGLEVASTQKISDIKAPMPGLVLSVAVKEGDEVDEGTPLLVLEAMKMENLIKSPSAGVVKTIEVAQGQAVEKGQLMISLD